MKIMVFGGGLGNQIFEYAFFLYIRDKFPDERIYGLYNKKRLSEHYGLEIDRWFDVELPPQKWYATFLTSILYLYKKVVGSTRLVETGRDFCENDKATVFLAFKYTSLYFPSYEWLKFKINEDTLSQENRDALFDIRTSNSVFIHVRRGDFLSTEYKKLFEGTCPLGYYEKAIFDINQKVESPSFFVFSDDILWAKDNLPLDKCHVRYIDWNKGAESPLDMFLMSQCKYAIMANSTFSYWGALLGCEKKMVFYPTKWINGYATPQIFKKDWITY